MKQGRHIHTARRKMSHVVDEISAALLLAGGTELSLSMRREAEGFRLQVKGNFDPEHRREMVQMAELLQPAVRNPAMVEEFWELAGSDRYTSDSELALVGQMVDDAQVEVGQEELSMALYIGF